MIQQQNVNKPNETPILFVNFRTESFTFRWDNVPYTLQAKETRWLPFWLAEHAAKHLVDIEMNERKLPTDHHSRESFIAKCIGNKPSEKAASDPLGLEVLNNNMNAKTGEEPKKPGRPKKKVQIPLNTVLSDEDSFEGK